MSMSSIGAQALSRLIELANSGSLLNAPDVGSFLQNYIVSGGVVTKNIVSNNTIDVTKIVVSFGDDVLTKDAVSFQTQTASTIYYLDFANGSFAWGLSHAAGTVDVDYLAIAEVTTDANKNVNVITDKATKRSTFRLKSGYTFPEVTALNTDLTALEAETTQDYTVNLYVATTGNDSNDGLSSGAPFLTIQKSFDTVAGNSYRTDIGTWKINISAGTYNEQCQFSPGLKSKNRIQIIGAVDGSNIPTVLLDGGSGVRSYGMSFSDLAFISVKDVKFRNFTSTTHSGIVAQHFSNLYCNNVHAYNCGFAGINAISSRLYVQGGIIDLCRDGIRLYSNSLGTIGYGATNLATGTTIKNCTEAGIIMQNQSSGHVDYCTIDGNDQGIYLVNQSRAHVMGSDIKNNTIGVLAITSSTWYNNPVTANIFTANTENFKNLAFGTELTLHEEARSSLHQIIDTAQVSHTGTTAETDLKVSYLIPPNVFIYSGKKYHIKASGTFAGAGTKTIRVRFDTGNIIGFVSAAGSTKDWQIECEIFAVTSSSQKVIGKWHEGNAAYNTDYLTTAFDMTVDKDIKITGTLSDAAGTITVEILEIIEVV